MKPKNKRAAKAPVLPSYLDGLEGLLPSYKGVIAVNQSDGGHAGLNAFTGLKQLCKPLGIPITVLPKLGPLGVMYGGLASGGVTINKVSLAAGRVEPLTSLRRVDAAKLAAAWTHRVSPVFNICASGATKPPKPTIRRDALTVLGMSGSVFYWTFFATVAALALQPEVRDRLRKNGELCETILDVLINCVAEPDNDGYFPDMSKVTWPGVVHQAGVISKAANGLK